MSCAIHHWRRSPTLCSIMAVRPLSAFVLVGSWFAPATAASVHRRSGTLMSGIPSSFAATGSRTTIPTKPASIGGGPSPSGRLESSFTGPGSPPVILRPAPMVTYDGPRITQFRRRFRRPPSTFVSRRLFRSRLLITIIITGVSFPRLPWTWPPVSRPSGFLSCRLRQACRFAENKLDIKIFKSRTSSFFVR